MNALTEQSVQSCPFDQTPIENNLPENEAILGLIAINSSHPSSQTSPQTANRDKTVNHSYDCVEVNDIPYYRKCIDCIKQMALLLRPQQQSNKLLIIYLSVNQNNKNVIQLDISLSRPMQRKLITLLHCQVVDGEGRTRAMRNARSIGERALAELLIKHQDSHQLRSLSFTQ